MNMQVSQTILEQLGGRRFIAMTGAKRFVGGNNTLSFKLPSTPHYVAKGINGVRITLNPSDTYTVSFFKSRGHNQPTLVEEHSEIYNDMLQDVFTMVTGLQTSLGTMRAVRS